MNYAELDWSTITPEFLDNKVAKLTIALKTKNYTEERITKSVIRYYSDWLLNAWLLGYHDIARIVYDRINHLRNIQLSETEYEKSLISYLEKTLPSTLSMFVSTCAGRILVCREKHGDNYYDISNPNRAAGTVVEVMRSRLDDGYYYTQEDNTVNDQPDLFQKPEETVQQRVKRLTEMAANDETKRIWAAFHLTKTLFERSDYEYEGVSIEYARIVE